MTRKEHLEFCTICKNQTFNPNKGVICKLTHEIANFEGSCEFFIKDEEQEEIEFEKKMSLAANSSEGSSSDYKKNQRMGTVAFIVGVSALVITLEMENIPIIIIPFGLILWGIRVYFKGVEQEKLWKEREAKSK